MMSSIDIRCKSIKPPSIEVVRFSIGFEIRRTHSNCKSSSSTEYFHSPSSMVTMFGCGSGCFNLSNKSYLLLLMVGFHSKCPVPLHARVTLLYSFQTTLYTCTWRVSCVQVGPHLPASSRLFGVAIWHLLSLQQSCAVVAAAVSKPPFVTVLGKLFRSTWLNIIVSFKALSWPLTVDDLNFFDDWYRGKADAVASPSFTICRAHFAIFHIRSLRDEWRHGGKISLLSCMRQS